MQTLKLEAKWTYRSPTETIVYPKGSYSVRKEIYDAAVTAGAIKEKADGGSGAKTGAANSSGDAKS